jgi:ribose transport system permease protein
VDPFVATLGTAAIVFGLISWHTGGLSIIVGIPESVMRFGGGDWLGVPRVFYLLVLVAAVVYYLLEHTPYGRSLHAVGSNRQAAHLVGIRVRRTLFGSFVLSGLLAGVAGVLLLAYSGSGNPQVGPNFTLTAVAAAFLSAAAFRPGQVNVAGALVAIYFIAVNITGLQYAGVPEYVDDVFTGLVLVLALALTRFARTR